MVDLGGPSLGCLSPARFAPARLGRRDRDRHLSGRPDKGAVVGDAGWLSVVEYLERVAGDEPIGRCLVTIQVAGRAERAKIHHSGPTIG
jgi:hypothetical protein